MLHISFRFQKNFPITTFSSSFAASSRVTGYLKGVMGSRNLISLQKNNTSQKTFFLFNLHHVRYFANFHRRFNLLTSELKKRLPLEMLGAKNPPPMGPEELDKKAPKNRIYKFLVGIDQLMPKMLSSEQANQFLNDPFANLLLKKEIFPLTMDHLHEELKKISKQIDVFVIAENGQIPWKTNATNVSQMARIVLSARVDSDNGPDILVSTGIKTYSTEQFLQLMSWDPKVGAYNFYQRLEGFWIWSGNGLHALSEETRGKGPFSGHINGGPIMKELRSPWQHWNSSEATIFPTSFRQDHPFVKSDYFQKKKNADDFEPLYKAAASRWNESRITHAIGEDGKTIENPKHLLLQIISTTNINLISSPDSSRSKKEEIGLPFTFFANFFALEKVDINPDASRLTVPRAIYEQSLSTFNFHLKSNDVVIPGDNHFAFFVPEPAFEDIDLLGKMIEKEIISEKLAACILMVDFQNPIYSAKRLKLEEYIPMQIVVGNKGQSLDIGFVQNIQASPDASKVGSPEYEFLANWSIGEDWQIAFTQRVEAYFAKVREACNTQDGFDNFVRLAESRRNNVKKSALYEFEMTFPITNISDESFPLEMTVDGEVISYQKS